MAFRGFRRTASPSLLAAALGLAFCPPPAGGVPARRPASTSAVSAPQGTVVRWSAPGTRRCAMRGRVWPALEEACYYPVDILQKPVVLPITRWTGKRRVSARLSVESHDYGTEDIQLPDIPQAHPSPEDERRNAREQSQIARVWKRRERPARFTLPLGAPANPLPPPKTFGFTRLFNGKLAEQPHMGADYAIPIGTPILAVADGTVVLAEDLFYPGNAVFIDHGDGLVSMSFHLSEIDVQPGQEVRRGQKIGLAGSTGRATGPHLFFAVRWHGARIDPEFLLGDPGRIPSVD